MLKYLKESNIDQISTKQGKFLKCYLTKHFVQNMKGSILNTNET